MAILVNIYDEVITDDKKYFMSITPYINKNNFYNIVKIFKLLAVHAGLLRISFLVDI